MCAVLGLAVDLRVEVHVVQDDGVGAREVEALAKGGPQQEQGEENG